MRRCRQSPPPRGPLVGEDVLVEVDGDRDVNRDECNGAWHDAPMRLRPLAALAATSLCFLASVASAQQHSGATMRLVLGAGIAEGAYEYRGLSNPGFAEPVRMLEWESRISGPTISAAVQPGWWLSRNVALVGELGSTVQRGSAGVGGGTGVLNPIGWHGLIMADYEPIPVWHLQAGAGYAQTGFGVSSDMAYRYDNIVHPRAVSGPCFALGGGYDPNGTVGLLARFTYSHLSNDDSSYHPVMASLQVSFTLF